MLRLRKSKTFGICGKQVPFFIWVPVRATNPGRNIKRVGFPQTKERSETREKPLIKQTGHAGD
jgi:hypothetical protein